MLDRFPKRHEQIKVKGPILVGQRAGSCVVKLFFCPKNFSIESGEIDERHSQLTTPWVGCSSENMAMLFVVITSLCFFL